MPESPRDLGTPCDRKSSARRTSRLRKDDIDQAGCKQAAAIASAGLSRYFPDRCYSLRCLKDLASPSAVARPTTLPKNWWPSFLPRPRSNSNRYSKLSCSICGNATQPAAAKRCCACGPMKSFKVSLTRERSTGRSPESRKNIKASRREWSCCALR